MKTELSTNSHISARQLEKIKNQLIALAIDQSDIIRETSTNITQIRELNIEVPNGLEACLEQSKKISADLKTMALGVASAEFEARRREEMENVAAKIDGQMPNKPINQPKTAIGRTIARGMAWLESKVA